jgi:phosphatidate cytidylyltransferase
VVLGSWLAGLVVGAVAGIVGPVGDLFESALKREVGVKDLGALIPGHGGVLDRFDSLLFVAPVAAIILLWLAPGR